MLVRPSSVRRENTAPLLGGLFRRVLLERRADGDHAQTPPRRLGGFVRDAVTEGDHAYGREHGRHVVTRDFGADADSARGRRVQVDDKWILIAARNGRQSASTAFSSEATELGLVNPSSMVCFIQDIT